jgi:hypothetical protein
MRNFQIFSIILAIIVVILVAQVVFTDYVPDWFEGSGDTAKTDVLNKLGDDLEDNSLTYDYFSDENDLDSEIVDLEDSEPSNLIEVIDLESPRVEENLIMIGQNQDSINFETVNSDLNINSNTNGLIDFEEIGVNTVPINPYLREEQLKSAGFLTAYIEEENNDLMLYKTIYLGDMENTIMRRFLLRDEALLYARVYVFSPDAGNTASSIYNSLKQKCALNANSSVNETNQFGKASFYMNDDLRKDTAFLNVRYNSLVYSFSYPKIYHNQVTNLIKLIALEKK